MKYYYMATDFLGSTRAPLIPKSLMATGMERLVHRLLIPLLNDFQKAGWMAP